MTPRERQQLEGALTRTLAHATPSDTIPQRAITACVAAIAPTDAEPLAASCTLCGQPIDPEPDGSEPVCTDCRIETTKRREPRC